MPRQDRKLASTAAPPRPGPSPESHHLRSKKNALASRLGQSLRELRTLAGLTQEDLAKRCDVARVYVALIESGHRIPPLWLLMRMATILRFSVQIPPEGGADLRNISILRP